LFFLACCHGGFFVPDGLEEVTTRSQTEPSLKDFIRNFSSKDKSKEFAFIKLHLTPFKKLLG
jgi:hypothetical protein